MRSRRGALTYARKVFGIGLTALAQAQPFRALGGIHVRAGSERVRILENAIVGGAGNGITLGGDIDPPPPVIILSSPAPAAIAALAAKPVKTAKVAAKASRVAPELADQPERKTVPVTVAAKGQFLALVQDRASKPVADVDVYLDGSMTASDRSDAKGVVSIKTTPGAYTLDVAPAFEILNFKETREDGVVLNVITVGPRTVTPAAATSTAFLVEITIQENDISQMGLSGVGFALLAGAGSRARRRLRQANGAKATLLAMRRTGEAQCRARAVPGRHHAGA